MEFRARFGGVSRDIVVPVDHVVAIYARENGQGMAFPVPTTDGVRGPVGVPSLSAVSALPLAAVSTAPVRSLRLASGAEEAPAPAAPAASPSPAPKMLDTAPAAVPSLAGEPPDDGPPKGPRPSLKRIK